MPYHSTCADTIGVNGLRREHKMLVLAEGRIDIAVNFLVSTTLWNIDDNELTQRYGCLE